MDELRERIEAVVKRCQERAGDPEFQANARRLAEEEVQSRALMAEIERNNRLLRSGIPVGMWSGLADPKRTPALDAVRTHLDAPRACVFLTLAGKRGQGKTFASASAVYDRGGRFVDAHDLVRLSSFDAEWDDLARENVLAIDELGAEFMNDSYRANLYALLNRRYADQRKTVLATNLDAPAFRARYCAEEEDRLLERLVKGGTWVNLSGESMRTHWADGPPPPHWQDDHESNEEA